MGGIDDLAPLENLPEAIEQEEDRNTNVSSEEASKLVRSPMINVGLREDSEAVEKDDPMGGLVMSMCTDKHISTYRAK